MIITGVYFAANKPKNKYNPNPDTGRYGEWEQAARDAEKTRGLSREERLSSYWVTYGSQPSAKTTPKAARYPTKTAEP